ncbi:flagellar assembly protein FliX [Plastoroseomonas hellenica]|uniref:Flagellar assembly protein FliX n=1 Tax=Plastoroseomonas hellenica TaxID=2687306 RepID=A0ABS5EZU1_9PROT|nr:flagellar assembly protein FliX [Plastoroseomonas hellenica]MBR0643463.1 hypothetical protein [Plastoroseomonas hellenica]MBR0665753.1 hypothetical protein [Plastoroseomonas hellenica]
MSGIRGITPGSGPVAPARAGRGGTAFRLGVAEEAPAARAGAAAAAQAVDFGLLSLQEGSTAEERDARARKRGLALLEELQEVQVALLGGRLDPARLARLASLSGGEQAADPALAEAVAAIALRARVELARLECAGLMARE